MKNDNDVNLALVQNIFSKVNIIMSVFHEIELCCYYFLCCRYVRVENKQKGFIIKFWRWTTLKKIKKANDESSEDDIPLASLLLNETEDKIYSECDDSDKDPDFIGQCDYKKCEEEIWKQCDVCEQLFCIFHLENHNPACLKPV
jgi:hypothetical protein